MQYNVAEAKAKLSALIAAAENGENVIIARGGHPAVRLVPFNWRGAFRFGLLDGRLGNTPDFFEPMPETELDLWD